MKSLKEKAMLVSLSMSLWTGRKKDKAITRKVISDENAEGDVGAWWTYLIPKATLKPLVAAYGRCRGVHNNMTLPWNDSGSRILPTKMFLIYSAKMREVTAEYAKCIDAFLEEYPKIIANADKTLGKLSEGVSFPTPDEIRCKFGVRQQIFPLPDAGDFRVDLEPDDVEKIQGQMRTDIEDIFQKGLHSIYVKLSDLVGKVHTALDQPDKIFRDSLIGNLKEFCEMLPKLNLTDDENLENIRQEIVEKVSSLDPETLRENETDRKDAANAAKELLNKMKSYYQP